MIATDDNILQGMLTGRSLEKFLRALVVYKRPKNISSVCAAVRNIIVVVAVCFLLLRTAAPTLEEFSGDVL